MTCEACQTIPPVVSEKYTPKGTYETIAGLKTYITGPPNPTKAILEIYDIFGFSPQALQGADMLSTAVDAVILVPDLLDGDYARHEWMGLDPQERRELFSKLMAGSAAIPKNVEKVFEVVHEARGRFPDVRCWGVLGLCWGGKVAAVSSAPKTPFTVSGQVHPGLADKSDAQTLTIPHILLASKDESPDAIAGYKQIIESNGKGGYVETYHTMWHGWMGARADLRNEQSRGEFIRGYTQLAGFFGKYLK